MFVAGCSHAPKRAVERVASGPFDNLTGNADYDWLSLLLPAAAQSEVAGAPDVTLVVTRSESDAEAARPSQLLRGYYTVEGGEVIVHAVLTDVATQKNVRRIEARAASSGGAAGLAEALAKAFVAKPRPFPTANAGAARLFGEALLPDNSESEQILLRQAIAMDPDFGAARLLLVQALVAQGNRDAALVALHEALEPARKLGEIDRARLEVFETGLEGTREAQLAAAERLARLTPAEPEPAVRLANMYLEGHRVKEAAEEFQKALRAQPEAVSVWNDAAYTEARAGDLDAARHSLDEYARLAPGNPNPKDSLGEILLQAGHFAEAEQAFLDSYQMNPGFLAATTLRKAAIARRLTGDLAGADTQFGKYLDAAASDPLVDIRKAQWQYSSGRHAEALTTLRTFIGEHGGAELSAAAMAQMAVWQMDSSDRAAAHATALTALQQAHAPGTQRIALVCAFVSDADVSPAEWEARAQRELAQMDEPTRRIALGYALLLGKHFQEAAPILQEQYDRTHPNAADHIKELLALAYAEQGKWDQAKPLLALWPIPELTGDSTFDFLVFPKGVELRAEVAERSGDASKAAELRRVYEKLSGGKAG